MIDQKENEELSLGDILAAFWSYRIALSVTFIIGLILFTLAALGMYALAPAPQSATLPFRLLFDGAAAERYPNGLPFSPTDIIAGPVLEKVYQQNALHDQLTFDQFKGAVFVSENNEALTLLDQEYQQKLANSKLSTVDRQLLENEYREKRQSLRNESYELHLLQDNDLFSLPKVMIDKVFKDILRTWVTLSDEQKGVLKYRIPILSRNILPATLLDAQDYIVTIDIFNTKIGKIFSNIDQLSALPGAHLVRVGEEKIGLTEVVSNLRDTQSFKLEPLVGLVRSTGLSKNPELAALYLENQLFQIKLDQQEAQEKIAVLENSLNTYLEKKQFSDSPVGADSASQPARMGPATTTYIPQFGDSFLDRIVEMSTYGNDAEFRQKAVGMIVDQGLNVAALEKKARYYSSLIEAMKKKSNTAQDSNDILTLIKARFTTIENDILIALDQINAIYETLSVTNLNPQGGFYTITAPVKITEVSPVNFQKLVVAGIAALMLLTLLASLGCFIHQHFSTHRRK